MYISTFFLKILNFNFFRKFWKKNQKFHKKIFGRFFDEIFDFFFQNFLKKSISIFNQITYFATKIVFVNLSSYSLKLIMIWYDIHAQYAVQSVLTFLFSETFENQQSFSPYYVC